MTRQRKKCLLRQNVWGERYGQQILPRESFRATRKARFRVVMVNRRRGVYVYGLQKGFYCGFAVERWLEEGGGVFAVHVGGSAFR